MTDTPTEREARALDQAAPPQGRAVGARLRRRRVGIPAGPRVCQRAPSTGRDQIRQIATLALLIGLPIVLVLAWYHGDRGEQRVSDTELAILTLLFLLGGGIFWRYERARERPHVGETERDRPHAAATGGLRPTQKSIAVLPFVNMSAAKEKEYISDGIAEEMLNVLARAPDLKVIARTSSFAFKGEKVEIADIAKRLNVAHVLEGSVRTSGNKLRITAQLIRDSRQHAPISLPETYDRTLEDIFAVQDEIAAQVVDATDRRRLLGQTVGGTASEGYGRPTRFCLQGRSICASRAEDYERAIAVPATGRLDARARRLPQAWVGTGATCRSTQADAGSRFHRQMAMSKLARLLKSALALDTGSCDRALDAGHGFRHTSFDWISAEESIGRALALEPGNATVLLQAVLDTSRPWSIGRSQSR